MKNKGPIFGVQYSLYCVEVELNEKIGC